MYVTFFFAQLWGPILLAIGFGIFLSRAYYVKLYRDLDKNPLAVLPLGLLFMIVGIIQTAAHHAWSTLPQIIITLLGWGTLIKGIMFLAVPHFIHKAAHFETRYKLLPIAGFIMGVLGLYLTILGYVV